MLKSFQVPNSHRSCSRQNKPLYQIYFFKCCPCSGWRLILPTPACHRHLPALFPPITSLFCLHSPCSLLALSQSLSLMSVVCFNEFVVDGFVCHPPSLPLALCLSPCHSSCLLIWDLGGAITSQEAPQIQTHTHTQLTLCGHYVGDRGDISRSDLRTERLRCTFLPSSTRRAETHTCMCMEGPEEFFSRASHGRQLCPDVLIIFFISSLLINDPSVPSHWCSTSELPHTKTHSHRGSRHNPKPLAPVM